MGEHHQRIRAVEPAPGTHTAWAVVKALGSFWPVLSCPIDFWDMETLKAGETRGEAVLKTLPVVQHAI